MLIGALSPAARVIGRLGPAIEKYLAVIEALLIVIEVGPEFVAVAAITLLVPGTTLPKFRLLAPIVRMLVCDCFGLSAFMTWHPLKKGKETSSTVAAICANCFEKIVVVAVFRMMTMRPSPLGCIPRTRGRLLDGSVAFL